MIDNIFDKLFEHYGVNSLVELADKMNSTQSTLSNWKARNSISAIKKRCRELGIYKEIFGESSVNNTVGNNSDGNTQAGGNITSISKNDNVSQMLFNALYTYATQNNKIDELNDYLSKGISILR